MIRERLDQQDRLQNKQYETPIRANKDRSSVLINKNALDLSGKELILASGTQSRNEQECENDEIQRIIDDTKISLTINTRGIG